MRAVIFYVDWKAKKRQREGGCWRNWGLKSSSLEREKQSLCVCSAPQQCCALSNNFEIQTRMGLGDEKTTKQIMGHSSRYRRGLCRECGGPSWTLLFCFLDKGKLVRLNIFQGNRNCFQRALAKQQV